MCFYSYVFLLLFLLCYWVVFAVFLEYYLIVMCLCCLSVLVSYLGLFRFDSFGNIYV